MLVKKLIASAMATGLLWAAGWASHAAVVRHPGLLMVAGQLRLFLGDEEGGLRLMECAAQQDQAARQDPVSEVKAVAAPAPAPAQCSKQVASRRPVRLQPARLVTVKVEAPGLGFATRMAHERLAMVRLSLEQARLGEMRARLLQPLHDLPPVPAAPREPVANTP